jgi:hypothetical protein
MSRGDLAGEEEQNNKDPRTWTINRGLKKYKKTQLALRPARSPRRSPESSQSDKVH